MDSAKHILEKMYTYRSQSKVSTPSEERAKEINIFVIDRDKRRTVNLFKSSGLVSLGMMIVLTCFWFWVDSINDMARAEVLVEKKVEVKEYENKAGEIKKIPTDPIEDNVPNKVEIKDLGIKLEVVPQITKEGKVGVSETKANYLVGSGVIGEQNNVVIFAHKRNGMFGNLSQIKNGATILVKSKDRVAEYEVISAYETRNNDMTVVMPDGFYGLTLYTCNRWDDSHRFVVRAKETRTYEAKKDNS